MAQGLEMERNATEPTNPATGYTRVYIDTDGDLAYKRPDGSVGKLKGSGVLDLAGYDLTLAADSTLAGSLTGGGAVTVPTGQTAAFARGGTAMIRGSNSDTGRVPIFGTNTDVLDGDAGLSYNSTADRLTASGGFVGARVQLTEQGSTPDAVSSYTVVFVDSGGDLCWRKDGGEVVKLAAAGTYTLTIPATGTAALLGTAQTFSAAQTFSNVLTAPGIKPANNSPTALQLQNAGGTPIVTVDTTNGKVTTGAQVIDLSSDVIGLLINTIASPTADAFRLDKNGSAMIRFDLDVQPRIQLQPYDNGPSIGSTIALNRNTNASTPSAGVIEIFNLANTRYYLWPDASGNLRIGTSAPINANDTSGTVVGTQTSSLDSKDLLGEAAPITEVLAAVREGAEAVRRFVYKSGAYNGEEFSGVVVDYAPRYGMDKDEEHPAGKTLNVVTAIGDLLMAIANLAERVEALEKS